MEPGRGAGLEHGAVGDVVLLEEEELADARRRGVGAAAGGSSACTILRATNCKMSDNQDFGSLRHKEVACRKNLSRGALLKSTAPLLGVPREATTQHTGSSTTTVRALLIC